MAVAFVRLRSIDSVTSAPEPMSVLALPAVLFEPALAPIIVLSLPEFCVPAVKPKKEFLLPTWLIIRRGLCPRALSGETPGGSSHGRLLYPRRQKLYKAAENQKD